VQIFNFLRICVFDVSMAFSLMGQGGDQPILPSWHTAQAVRGIWLGGGTMADSPESGNGKPRKRSAGKVATGPVAGKVKATIHLSVDADKRLSVHAVMMNMDRSELIEYLIHEHLRRYVVSDRGQGGEVASGDAAA
jgi:hypothetical protein